MSLKRFLSASKNNKEQVCEETANPHKFPIQLVEPNYGRIITLRIIENPDSNKGLLETYIKGLAKCTDIQYNFTDERTVQLKFENADMAEYQREFFKNYK